MAQWCVRFWGKLSAMVDNFSILLSHALLLIAFWYLTKRDDLDTEAPPTPDTDPEGFVKKRVKPGQINRSDARQDKT
jgi:hypothetical protein